jgi:hypothetical protein
VLFLSGRRAPCRSTSAARFASTSRKSAPASRCC